MSFDRATYINEPAAIDAELKLLFNENDRLIIFEVGACEGEDSIKYSRLFPNASIYSFEPLPENIRWIEKNFLTYGITNARYFNKALSSKNGTAEFYVSSGRPGDAPQSDWDFGNKSSSLLPPANHMELAGFIRFDNKIKVETVTLKSFCQANDINVIDFLHMDVQGAELMVLQGAGDFISKIKTIWLEVSKVDLYKDQPLVGDVQKFMKKNNFVLFKVSLYGVQGDQLYISAHFFPGFKRFFLAGLLFFTSIINRIRRKAVYPA